MMHPCSPVNRLGILPYHILIPIFLRLRIKEGQGPTELIIQPDSSRPAAEQKVEPETRNTDAGYGVCA